MTYLVLVEPSEEHRRAFARWCLEQTPPIMTTNASGSEVPSALFAAIPDEILDGSHIDGRPFRPVVEGKSPEGDGYRPADVVPVNDGAQPEPLHAEAPARPRPRQRRTRKGAGQ